MSKWSIKEVLYVCRTLDIPFSAFHMDFTEEPDYWCMSW